jgi:uncharacterized membrane protein (DUF106 family)
MTETNFICLVIGIIIGLALNIIHKIVSKRKKK